MKPSLFVLGPGGSIYDPGRKGLECEKWKVLHHPLLYSTLIYTSYQEYSRIPLHTGALQLSPTCLSAMVTATHPPTWYILEQTISSSTQNTQDLIGENNNLFNKWIICFVSRSRERSVFLSVYIFTRLTREYLYIMQTNKLKEILVLFMSTQLLRKTNK